MADILLIDTSSRKIEFAFCTGDRIDVVKNLYSEYNADLLTYEIRNAVKSYKLKLDDLKYIGFSSGPGSFTGLRIGLAVAKGLCYALSLKLIEVISLDIIANKIRFTQNSYQVITALIVSNSKDMDFYTADYKQHNGYIERISDYRVMKISKIDPTNRLFVLNEEENVDLPEGFFVLNVFAESNIDSLLKLTRNKITKGEFSDLITSEPFYMKQFTPLQNKIKA
ncbi:MAG: tRNA (adenosine(37)-N6)-threonylcarbamoyltransferase complex dimerization subunit type 1 TsaB [Ignavibacteria bacterium]